MSPNLLTSRSFHFKSQQHLTVALSRLLFARTQRETRDWISSSDLKTCCALGRLIVDILLIACDAGTRRREREWVKGHWTCTCDRFFIFIFLHHVILFSAQHRQEIHYKSQCCMLSRLWVRVLVLSRSADSRPDIRASLEWTRFDCSTIDWKS